jgi:protein TonB
MAPARLRSRFTGSLPISIGVHFIVIVMLLIIPLTATLELPDPSEPLPEYMRVALPPPPPPAPPARVRPPSAAQPPDAPPNPDAAPIKAPDAIKAEGPPPVVPDVGTAQGVGEPGGIGVGTGDRPIVLQPPDPPRPAGPVRVADLPVTPRKIGDVRPVYPEIARAAHLEGTVIMEAVLDTSGRVTQLRVIQSAPMFDQAALDAVRQWRYTPSLYGGRPVSVLMTITVRFTLQ